MMRQTAALSGSSGGLISRKSRSVRSDDFYQERYSSTGLDLLDPQSRQGRPQQNWQEPSYSSLPLIVEAQTFSKSLFSEEEEVPQAIIEESGPQASQSLSDLLDNLQGIPQSATAHAQVVRRFFPRPGTLSLSEDSRRIIGEHGLRRFEDFRRYHAGWDYGRGQPLSSRSVTTLESFLGQLTELSALEPSLFLTQEGNLQLGWEDAFGNVVELEFYPDKIEYYIENLNEEGTVELDALHHLVDKVRPTVL